MRRGPKYRYTWSRPRRNTYLPTYLVRSLSFSSYLFLSFPPTCSTASPYFIHGPPRVPLVARARARAIPLEVHAMMHAIEQRRGLTDQWLTSSRRRRASRRCRRFLSFLFFSFSLLSFVLSHARFCGESLFVLPIFSDH